MQNFELEIIRKRKDLFLQLYFYDILGIILKYHLI